MNILLKIKILLFFSFFKTSNFEQIYVKITKIDEKSFCWESNKSYQDSKVELKAISEHIHNDIDIINDFFNNKEKNEIYLIFEKPNRKKNKIFFDTFGGFTIKKVLEKKDFPKKINLKKEIVNLKKEKKELEDNAYYLIFNNLFEVYSTLPKDFFSKREIFFIKMIEKKFKKFEIDPIFFEDNLIIAIDKRSNNILGQAYFRYLNEKDIYIDKLTINNSVNFSKGIGTNLLKKIKELGFNIILSSTLNAEGFYKKNEFTCDEKNSSIFKFFNEKKINKKVFLKLDI